MIIKNKLRSIYYFNSLRKFKQKGGNLIFSKGGVFIRPEEISLGSNIFISRNFHISARNLFFGSDIMIGPNLVVECDNHTTNLIGKRMFEVQNIRNGNFVKIEDDVWIGANVTILSNTIISEGTIVGAGSIVNKSLPPYSICVGLPCKPIKPRFSIDELIEHFKLVKTKYKIDDIIKIWKKQQLI